MATRVLVLDDSLAIQKAIQVALDRHPVDLNFAATAEAGRQVLAQGLPDVVFLSERITLPTELSDQFQRSSDRVVLVCSNIGAEAAPHWLVAAKRLNKPFTSQDVIASVEKCIGQRLSSEPNHAPGTDPLLSNTLPGRQTQADMQQQIEAAVRSYCQEHFRSIAKEVITEELGRLTAEHLSSPDRS